MSRKPVNRKTLATFARSPVCALYALPSGAKLPGGPCSPIGVGCVTITCVGNKCDGGNSGGSNVGGGGGSGGGGPLVTNSGWSSLEKSLSPFSDVGVGTKSPFS